MARRYGLVGYPLGHSFSARYFTERFASQGIDAKYDNYPIESVEQLRATLPGDICGFNVTIPHKQNIIPLLSEIDPEAQSVGAVNCVRVMPDGMLKGYNTDVYGFEYSLRRMLESRTVRNEPLAALVLGSGGASRAVEYVLRKMNIKYITVSRTPHADNQLSYSDLSADVIATHKLIINATPLGTTPRTDLSPELQYTALGQDHYLYDLVYNPALTRFLDNGRKQGAHLKSGLEMLILQAERSWEIWNEQ